jgi:hypothetical protein
VSMVDPSILAGRMKPRVAGVPVEDEQLRFGRIVKIEMDASPPVVLVGDAEEDLPMRVVGNPWDYHPGDTVIYALIPGGPVVLGILPMVGSELDPTDEDFTPWREIGAAGEPAFQNSWVNFGGVDDHETAAFWQQSDGWVRLKGLIKDGTATDGTTIFTLPSGYRPVSTQTFVTWTNAATAVIRISSLGNVQCHANCSSVSLSLNGIAFPGSWTNQISTFDEWVVNHSRWSVPDLGAGMIPGNVTTIGDHLPNLYVRSDGWVWAMGAIDTPSAAAANLMKLVDHAAKGYHGLVLCGFGFGIARYTVGGHGNAGAYGPRNWYNDLAVDAVHYLGGLNYFGIGGRRGDDCGQMSQIANFLNGWNHFSGAYQLVRYYKDVHGVVHVNGLAQGNASTADTIFNLPAGYRPGKRQVFNGMWNNAQGRTDVLANGDVIAVGHPNNTWHALSSIMFRAMQ